MSRFQPSLIRRVALGFVFGPILTILALMIASRPLLANLEHDNVGPQIAAALLSADLRKDAAGRLTLRNRSDVPTSLRALRLSGSLRQQVTGSSGSDPFRLRYLLSYPASLRA